MNILLISQLGNVFCSFLSSSSSLILNTLHFCYEVNLMFHFSFSTFPMTIIGSLGIFIVRPAPAKWIKWKIGWKTFIMLWEELDVYLSFSFRILFLNKNINQNQNRSLHQAVNMFTSDVKWGFLTWECAGWLASSGHLRNCSYCHFCIGYII